MIQAGDVNRRTPEPNLEHKNALKSLLRKLT